MVLQPLSPHYKPPLPTQARHPTSAGPPWCGKPTGRTPHHDAAPTPTPTPAGTNPTGRPKRHRFTHDIGDAGGGQRMGHLCVATSILAAAHAAQPRARANGLARCRGGRSGASIPRRATAVAQPKPQSNGCVACHTNPAYLTRHTSWPLETQRKQQSGQHTIQHTSHASCYQGPHQRRTTQRPSDRTGSIACGYGGHTNRPAHHSLAARLPALNLQQVTCRANAAYPSCHPCASSFS